MGIPMTGEQAGQFDIYHNMLVEANARMNLTRVPDDIAEAVDRNYLDCIAPLSRDFPAVKTAVDVGSGAGFPGIPLAIMLPEVRFTLMDALQKRVDFLQSVIDALHLNAEAAHLRAEDAARRDDLREGFDLAVARAVAPMNVLCEYMLPLVKVGGHMLALKGPGLDEELARAENALKLWEPVLVLHTSVDGNWLLVQAYDYLGWVETQKVALCEREQWDALRAQLQTDYLTVLAPRLVLDGSFHHPGQEHIVLKMGTVLPLTDDKEADNAISDNCYIVRLPRRLEDGSLETYTARIPQNEDVTVGSLPFTTENLLRQVFKLLGHRYGWGGTAEGWDCSSICQDAYRTVGLFLPRNSGNQRRIPDCHNVENASLDQKRALLDTLQPGAMLELPGHQTMYIGAFEGDHYVIHATHGVYDSNMDFYNANSVIVSSVQALRSNGKSLLQNFRGFSMPVAD